MNINNLDQARGHLRQLEELYYSDHEDTKEYASQFIDLIHRCPALTKDQNSEETLCMLSEAVYARKEHLPTHQQEQMIKIFLAVHHLTPTLISEELGNDQPAKILVKEYKGAEAVIYGSQDYPVPLELLSHEEMPCGTYFEPLLVKLADGAQVSISQGMLAHFSFMVRKMLQNIEMKPSQTLILNQLNRHQFDSLVAFLSTGQTSLIDEGNALPLLHTATYLETPELFEACKRFLHANLDNIDGMGFVYLLNLLPKSKENKFIIASIENRISKMFKEALIQNPVPSGFMQMLAYYKKNLQRPFSLNLSGSAITDDKLELLEGLPIKELQLYKCQHLTKKCLPVLKNLPQLKVLQLGNNPWVDDSVLAHLPPNVHQLYLTLGINFTKKGLSHLKQIHSLFLIGCRNLTDDDLTALPDIETLDLSLCVGIGENTLKHLSQMKKLKHLILLGTPLANQAMTFLPKQLVSLNLSGYQLSDASLKPISEMSHLEELSLSRTGIIGTELSSLPQSIVKLGLDSCSALEQEWIIPLAKRKNLREINLQRCPKITADILEPFFENKITVMWQEPQPSHLAVQAFNQR